MGDSRATWCFTFLAQCIRQDPTYQIGDRFFHRISGYFSHILPIPLSPQTKAGSGNDILRQLCSGKGREKEISGGADKEAPSERKALIDLDPEMCK